MLGGAFFSLNIAPKYIQMIYKLIPEAWAIKILKNVMFNSSSIMSQIIPLALFMIMGIMTSGLLIERGNRSRI